MKQQTDTQPLLRIEHLSKSYSGHRILDDVSLSVSRCEVTGIIGRSGAGKSTLLRCINMLEKPDGGHIWLKEEEIGFHGNQRKPVSAKTLARQRRSVGMVFQHFNLWPHRTVLQNITEGPVQVAGQSSEDATRTALALLDQMGLSDKANEYPVKLSGGQQQRVSIARALAMAPEVILFDEPTSALDPQSVSEVLNVMSRLAENGTTMVLVTHEMRFALQVCDRLILMEQGKIVSQVRPVELRADPDSAAARQFMALSGINEGDLL
ncbi:amino acid ABC transporter ATP-binding protein [Tatumella citrea]|uniref:Ectoine/hydroxyectoine ABC transporter ATP-binding protein EhuA n=1 Tax=Tatumella citrea TaxID=53336 RepID=A0A1Y0LK69_TATCI|nr:amino acid ABC transporter ATP-binding protein [Tatumella citrea]ARU94454.1 ectoine/hydroxyectoine ABC transporter ATP-binding protein EhuA [Tatumella citrea]ARU98493.1 ectoine/hydroxyectoine ABC transporter ATP-binding protein EhuA [Tatumella citrea]